MNAHRFIRRLNINDVVEALDKGFLVRAWNGRHESVGGFDVVLCGRTSIDDAWHLSENDGCMFAYEHEVLS